MLKNRIRSCPMVNLDGQTVQISDERLDQFRRNPLFIDKKRVQDLVPPERWHDHGVAIAIRSETSSALCACSSEKHHVKTVEASRTNRSNRDRRVKSSTNRCCSRGSTTAEYFLRYTPTSTAWPFAEQNLSVRWRIPTACVM